MRTELWPADESDVQRPGIAQPSKASELAIGIAAFSVCVTSLTVAPGLAGVLGASLGLIVVAIAVADARRFLVPDPLVACGVALALIQASAVPAPFVAEMVAACLLRAAVAAGLLYAVRGLYGFFRGREGIGLGDVKLAGLAGAWLDWPILVIALEAATLTALAVCAFRITVAKQPMRLATRLPFGLYFAPAIWVGWLLQALLVSR